MGYLRVYVITRAIPVLPPTEMVMPPAEIVMPPAELVLPPAGVKRPPNLMDFIHILQHAILRELRKMLKR